MSTIAKRGSVRRTPAAYMWVILRPNGRMVPGSVATTSGSAWNMTILEVRRRLSFETMGEDRQELEALGYELKRVKVEVCDG